jgi:4-alpha-glucanotransferase
LDLNSLIQTSPAKTSWEKIGLEKRHGINTPLFSLKTEKSSGIGEFLDLTLLIDWCAEIGFSIIQLLPLNDTGLDPSPYNALSAFALNPIYISLHALPFVKTTDLAPFQKINSLPELNYHEVLTMKMTFLKKYFQEHYHAIEDDLSYKAFVQTTEWLKPYAQFKALKERYENKSWQEWPSDYEPPSEESLHFYFFLQYFACKQLKWIKSYANQKGIFLKGDIPILISPDSVDVWLNKEDFDLDNTAGAPPDMFTPEGQSWGFPTYRWNNFHFWKARLNVASDFYDIFRLDHIIGFYRIWRIKKGETAKQGSFYPPDEETALKQGEFILKNLLSFTSMFPMGEDLGLFIDYIKASLNSLAIPGTKIIRWERHYESDNSFIAYKDYPPFSLTTVSTHDTETLSEWWTDFPDDAKQLCKENHLDYKKNLSPELRLQILHGAHHSASIFHINLLGEYLELIPSYSSKKMRINTPGKALKSNWSLRYVPTLEAMITNPILRKMLQSCL